MIVRTFVALALAVVAASSSTAQTLAYLIPLDGSQEVPPLATAAGGSAMISLGVTTGIVIVSGSYLGLSSNQTVAHIHGPAGPGFTAPPVVNLMGSGGLTGTISGSALLTPAQVADWLAGLYYVNVHSTLNPGGELRGQICLNGDVANRPGLPNPQSYTASPLVFGGTFQATVDLTTSGHDFAYLLGFDTAIDLPLPGGQRLLCVDLGGSGEIFTGAGLGPVAGPTAVFSLPLPANLSFCNYKFFSQALHFGGVTPYALSNAQDLTLGF